MENLQKMSLKAYDDLLQRPDQRHWCMAFFHPIVNCDTIENDLCEAFNARIIEARIN